jgi:hypothetical protein
MNGFTTTPLDKFQVQSLKPQSLKAQFTSRQGDEGKSVHFTQLVKAMGTQDTMNIRFGNVEPLESTAPNEDPATIARLDSLIPRLGEATDWKMFKHQDFFGNMTTGYDLEFTLGETRYKLRDVFEKRRDLPSWLNQGTVLIEEPAAGQKTKESAVREYVIKDDKTFYQYWRQFTKVADPIMGARVIDKIKQQPEQMTQPGYITYPTGFAISFDTEDNSHRLDWDREKGTYKLSEKSPLPSEEQLASFWQATVAFYTKNNAKRLETQSDKEQTPIPTLDEFKATYMKHWRRTNQYTITSEQFQELYDAIKVPMGSKLAETMGIGEDFNPRPLIRTILIQLLNSLSNSGVGYREHDERDEITYYPTKGRPDHDWQTALFFEISRFKTDDGTLGNYHVSSRGGKGGHINLEVTNQQDAAVLDKMMAFVKSKEAFNNVEMIERLTTNLGKLRNPNFEPEDYSQQKAALTARQAALQAELTEMLPTLRD